MILRQRTGCGIGCGRQLKGKPVGMLRIWQMKKSQIRQKRPEMTIGQAGFGDSLNR